MHSLKPIQNPIPLRATLAIFLLLAAPIASAQHEKVLHNFGNDGIGGITPEAGLISDAAGNLYGTTEFGGPYNGGAVFELSPAAGGGWTETVLRYFGHGNDGAGPMSRLVFDAAGNLYGTTYGGGVTANCVLSPFAPFGCGTVFELSPAAKGTWTETVLHRFINDGKDGINPEAGLILDSAGNLYGTTQHGGGASCVDYGATVGCGTAFELSRQANGAWTERVLHRFRNDRTDGQFPLASLVFDAAGNLYSTTFDGGAYATTSGIAGTVFELTPVAAGKWAETVIHNFGGSSDGAALSSGLTLDSVGNLYGSTLYGDVYSGTVFELSPSTGGWKETVLHAFDSSLDGYPYGTLIFDPAGNIYGTTGAGVFGTIFELSPQAGGNWTETSLYRFGQIAEDGTYPTGQLIFDSTGSLYGTTAGGGNPECLGYANGYGCGTFFSLTPSASGGWQESVLHQFGSPNSEVPSGPLAALVADASGDLFSTTTYVVYPGLGTAFELVPDGKNGYTRKTMHIFGRGTDGKYPYSGLVADGAGNFYGTTWRGGNSSCDCGTVFELSPTATGGWAEKVLHTFRYNGKDGFEPFAGLVFDSAGNLYGTTSLGGSGSCDNGFGYVVGCGTVFELSPSPTGPWAERVIYSFQSNGSDGLFPNGGLLFDATGNLYGTTLNGGSAAGCPILPEGCGTVFELSPSSGGVWGERILHSFNGADGLLPQSSLIQDASGNLYGTTPYGGTGCLGDGCGTVFELSTGGLGTWTETVLHNFVADGTDGYNPQSALIMDRDKNLYGTAYVGGEGTCVQTFTQGCGTVFELKHTSGGAWTEKILHSFQRNTTDGELPYAALIFDSAGNLYGTTETGGPYGGGTVFEITP